MLTAGSPRKTEITSSVPGLTDYMKGERAENPQMNYYRKKKLTNQSILTLFFISNVRFSMKRCLSCNSEL